MIKTVPFKEAVHSLSLPGFNKNLFASMDWLSVLDQTYKIKIFVKYIEREGKIGSYIIYSEVKNFLEWKICVCSYCDYFDCHVETVADWRALFESIRAEYPQHRIAVRNLRDEIARQSPDFQVLSKERYHFLDLQGTVDECWKRTHDSFKSAVKQAQKAGAVVKPCTKADLPKFFHMHLRLRKDKYRLFPQPYRFFENIWDQYVARDKGVMLGAFDPQGNLIAANIYLICDDTLYYKFNTSSLTTLSFRPNNLLFWEGIRFAKERNLKYLDLGSSGCEQEGLILFKNHTGAVMQDITHLGYAPPDYKFSSKRILKIMTRFFTSRWMPDAGIKIGSHLIYPYLA
jgi:CelD/BcsL family acetyltransferase involved in cellulose biosynthesis